jgi:hypothetical protein
VIVPSVNLKHTFVNTETISTDIISVKHSRLFVYANFADVVVNCFPGYSCSNVGNS